LSKICSGTKRDGSPCTLAVTGQQDRCWAHSPENAAQRRQTARKGGRGKASSVSKELHGKLVELTEAVEAGTLVPYRGAVCAQLINTRIRLIELDRKVREQEQIEERLERLERARAARGGSTRWRG
jgi:hypothetical protein